MSSAVSSPPNSTPALAEGMFHYAAVSFLQGPFNSKILQVTGCSTNEVEALLAHYGNQATFGSGKQVDITGHTPLDVTNYLADNFHYRVSCTSATQGEFVFVLERKSDGTAND